MKNRYWIRLKSRGFFLNIFLAHVVLLCFLLVAFYFYISSSLSGQYMEKMNAAIVNTLKNSATAIDITFFNLRNAMRQTFENQDVIRAMITPNTGDYERSVRVVRQLRNAVAGNLLVKGAALFVPTGKMVFACDGSVLPSIASGWSYVIDARENDPSDSAAWDSPTQPEVRILNGRIFICLDFFPPWLRNTGTLIFEIDATALYLMIFEDRIDGGNFIYSYDRNDTPVFPALLDYSFPPLPLPPPNPNSTVFPVDGKNGKRICFYHRSPLSGWQFLYPLAYEEYLPGSFATWQRILPFLVVILFISLPLSLLISARVYRPVHRLMKRIASAVPPEAAGSLPGDEMDYFSLAYSNAVDSNDRLRALVDGLSPAVVERLLTNLLLGRETYEREIDDLLTRIRAPLKPDARYAVMLISLQPPEDGKLSEVDIGLYMAALRILAGTELKNGASGYLLRIEDDVLALTMCFDRETPPHEIRQNMIRLRESVRRSDVGLPYRVAFGCGNLCDHIAGVRFSFLEALEDLRYSRFYGNDPARSVPDEEAEPIYGRAYFSRRCAHVLQSLNEGNSEHAREILRRAVSDIFCGAGSPQEAGKLCSVFVDCVLETLAVQKVRNIEEIALIGQDICRASESAAETSKELESAMLRLGDRFIDAMENHNSTRSRRYIQAARDYMENNYSDSGLSLNTLAERAGLNVSYFSRLFNEGVGRHFTDCLGELRVEKACMLLEETDMPVRDIAYKTGFSSMQNFFRVFKKNRGIPPGEYRQRHKK